MHWLPTETWVMFRSWSVMVLLYIFHNNRISPPGGDFHSDPVSEATLSCVQTFWAFDKKLAMRKHFPSISWVFSYSNNTNTNAYFASLDEEVDSLRHKISSILSTTSDLEEIAQLVGLDALAELDKITFFMSRIIQEDFLAQNIFSPYDSYCPLYKTIWMMRIITTFYDLAQKVIWKQTLFKRVGRAKLISRAPSNMDRH